MVKIDDKELAELREKAKKWDKAMAHRADHLNAGTAEERSARARKAVKARWEKAGKEGLQK